MTPTKAIEILREYNRQRLGTVQVGDQVRLKRDHALHTVTRFEEYDYMQPYQIDDAEWIGRADIEWPQPAEVTAAIELAIEALESIHKIKHQ